MIIKDGVLVEYEESDIDENGLCVIPDGVTSIGTRAFDQCENLTNVQIPDSVTDIGESAFEGCKNLAEIQISDSVTNIEKWAFHGCKNLTNVHIPDGVTNIGEAVFWECENLTSIKIPDGVTSIGEGAFAGCENLTNVHIPDGVTSIGQMAFTGCENLASITLPSSIIGEINYYDFSPNTLVQSTTKDGHKLSIYAGLGKVLQNMDMQDKIQAQNCEFVRKTVMKDDEVSPLKVRGDCLQDYYTLMYNLGLFSGKDVKITKNNKSQEPILNTGYNILRGLFSENNRFGSHLHLNDVHSYFQAMRPGDINEEFIKFMADKNNLSNIIAQELKQNGFIVRTLDWFETRKHMQNLGDIENESNLSYLPTSEANRYKIRRYETNEAGIDKIKWKTPTVEFLRKEFAENKFMGVTDETRDLADYLGNYSLYEQKHFNKAVEINQERIDKKIPDHILGEELKQDKWESYKRCEEKINAMKSKSLQVAGEIMENQADISDKVFTYEMLARSDNANFAMGFLTSCCATLYGAGAGAMRAMITDERIQPLVIRDSNDKIVSFGIVYVNKDEGYAVVNDFEVNKQYSGQDELREAIWNKVMEGVGAFVNKYNEKNAEKPISLVTCGISPNWDGVNEFVQQNPQSEILPAPDFSDYKYAGSGAWPGDWHSSQYVIWKAGEEQRECEQEQNNDQEQQNSNEQGGQNNGQQTANGQASGNGQVADHQLERA